MLTITVTLEADGVSTAKRVTFGGTPPAGITPPAQPVALALGESVLKQVIQSAILLGLVTGVAGPGPITPGPVAAVPSAK